MFTLYYSLVDDDDTRDPRVIKTQDVVSMMAEILRLGNTGQTIKTYTPEQFKQIYGQAAGIQVYISYHLNSSGTDVHIFINGEKARTVTIEPIMYPNGELVCFKVHDLGARLGYASTIDQVHTLATQYVTKLVMNR